MRLRIAPLPAMFKACLICAVLAAFAAPASAASFTMKRGINLDTWITWPGEQSWRDEATLRPFPEWRKRLTDADLAALKAGGFDFVRMPVDPGPFLSQTTAAYREKLYGDVLDATRALNAAGLNVIVDLHLFARSDSPGIGMAGVMDSAQTFDDYLEIVRLMARTLSQEDPARVALELMNEPAGDCETGKGDWPERLQKLFAAARSSATRTTLVLSGACGGGADGLAAIDPKDIPDDNIIWSFHSYQPFLMTHQGAQWAGDFIRYVNGLTYPLHAMPVAARENAFAEIRARINADAPWLRRSALLSYLDEQIAEIDSPEKLEAVLEKPFETVAAWARKNSVPSENIILGEFGMIRQEYENPVVIPAASRAAYASDMIRIAESHGFAWAIWGYGGAFGVVEEFEGRKAEDDVLDLVRSLP